MEATAIQPNTATGSVSQNGGFARLGGEDFLKLLIAQLVNQDPMEPTTNQELLQQISTIRDIEQSVALTRSLQRLIEQQRFGSAAGLMGRFVTGRSGSGDDAETVRGVVTAVRFDAEGQVVLMLDTGQELSLALLDTVSSAERAARELIGQLVTGVDTRDPDDLTAVEGIVTAVRTGEDGEVLLELDTGEELRFVDVLAAGPPAGDPGRGTSAGG